MTNLVSDELLKLAEIAPMSAGTRTKVRDAALRVQALEREHTALAKGWGRTLGDIYERSASEPKASQLHDRENRCVLCHKYRNEGAISCANCGLDFSLNR
jgi:hypothetical protein